MGQILGVVVRGYSYGPQVGVAAGDSDKVPTSKWQRGNAIIVIRGLMCGEKGKGRLLALAHLAHAASLRRSLFPAPPG